MIDFDRLSNRWGPFPSFSDLESIAWEHKRCKQAVVIMSLLPLLHFLLLKRETDQKRKTKFMSVLHVHWTVWVKHVNLFSYFPLKPAQQD